MNKIVRVAITVAFIFAIASIGFVSATPRTLKQVNMLYSTSENPDKWLPVAGNQVSDFKLKLDGNPATWYYLDIKFIKPAISVDYVPVNKPGDLFPFFLDPATYTTNAQFKAYWDTKLSDPANAPWAPIMLQIIHGNLPMFFLAVQTDGQYHLIDGLQFFLFVFGGYGQPFNPLRLNGDYPLGTYVFMADDSFYGNDLLTGSTMAITIR